MATKSLLDERWRLLAVLALASGSALIVYVLTNISLGLAVVATNSLAPG
jgi:hypothetical protein